MTGRMATVNDVQPEDPSPTRFQSWVARRIGRHLLAGALTIRWPDGGVSRLAGDLPGPAAVIEVRSLRALQRLVFGGALGLAESYMAGEWDSPDLAGAVELAALNRISRPASTATPVAARLAARFRHGLNGNSRAGSRRNIAFHYDLGNAFYREWLDPTLIYSSAVYETDAQPLEQAQLNKCRRLLSLLDPAPGQRMLEIGCGWGTFARVAAKERGVSVTAITLSREQYDHARRTVFEDGLADRVTVELRDYRDISDRYDHVASIEMFEAVGERYWPAYFAKLREALISGGRAALQVITIDDRLYPSYRRGVDFVQRHVFPGGMLPSPGVLRGKVAEAGLIWRADQGFGQHYARTLAEWRRQFAEAWPRVKSLGFDERFRRLWTLYLAYCEGGFRAGNIDVRQIVLERP